MTTLDLFVLGAVGSFILVALLAIRSLMIYYLKKRVEQIKNETRQSQPSPPDPSALPSLPEPRPPSANERRRATIRALVSQGRIEQDAATRLLVSLDQEVFEPVTTLEQTSNSDLLSFIDSLHGALTADSVPYGNFTVTETTIVHSPGAAEMAPGPKEETPAASTAVPLRFEREDVV